MTPNDNEQKPPNPTDKESAAAKSKEQIIDGAYQTDQLEKLNPDAQAKGNKPEQENE